MAAKFSVSALLLVILPLAAAAPSMSTITCDSTCQLGSLDSSDGSGTTTEMVKWCQQCSRGPSDCASPFSVPCNAIVDYYCKDKVQYCVHLAAPGDGTSD
jgi:hypothetical protein